MLVGIAWVPKGASVAQLRGQEDEGEQPVKMDTEKESESEEDTEDVGVDDVLADDFEGLRFHSSNRDDPYLDNKEEIYDEEEVEDLKFKDTDMPILTLRAGEDVSQLEVYVYEDDLDETDPNLYLHHETVLPGYPLSIAWSPYNPSDGDSKGNLAAVGTFLNGIDIWDLNEIESLEPLLSLGGYTIPRGTGRVKGKKKRQKKPVLVQDSHAGEVMSLSWNSFQQEYLASGAADKLVKCWDVESASCVSTFSHHSDKVQVVAWSPLDEAQMLSASFDKTVQVLDVRTGQPSFKENLSADAERAIWVTKDGSASIIATSEDGQMSMFDPRKAGEPLWSIRAHGKAVSACSLSSSVNGLLVTGSVEKTLKVWDINGSQPKELTSFSDLKLGAIFDAQLTDDKDHPLLVAVCGSKGKLKLMDMGVLRESEVLDYFSSSLTPKVVERTKMRCRLAKEARETSATGNEQVSSAEEVEESEESN